MTLVPLAQTPPPLPTALRAGLTVDDAVRIAAALDAAHAESTRRLYGHLWRVWERWCAARDVSALPADPVALAAYLVERAAEGTDVVSLNLACTAIRHVHRQHGLLNPAEDELVRQVRLGLRRTYGTAPRRQARPLTVPEIRHIIGAIDRSAPIGVRDTSIILLGFASALRGGELVELTLADVETKPGGILVTVRHSKTDLERHGQVVTVAHGTHAVTDPVAALSAWLKIRGNEAGALFTRIWDSRISDQPLRQLCRRPDAPSTCHRRRPTHPHRRPDATQGPRRPGQPLHPTPRSPRHHLQPRPRTIQTTG